MVHKPYYGTLVLIDHFICDAFFIWVKFKPQIRYCRTEKPYNRRALYIIPYIAFKISTYSPFLTFSYDNDFLYSGFTSHIIFKNPPSTFMCTTLSSGSYLWIYAPITSKVCTAIPSWASINNNANSASSAMGGNVAPFCGI